MTCTKEQIRTLFKYAQVYTQEIAAHKASMSLSTAKRYLAMKDRPKQKERKRSAGRTRKDPFAERWEEAKQLLANDPGLEAKTSLGTNNAR